MRFNYRTRSHVAELLSAFAEESGWITPPDGKLRCVGVQIRRRDKVPRDKGGGWWAPKPGEECGEGSCGV